MSKARKRFVRGATVLVRRHSWGGAWEPAVYNGEVAIGSGTMGYHQVTLPRGAERHFSRAGIEVDADEPGAIPTRNLVVPALRIKRGDAKQ